jgi:hypothetical protein
LNTCAVLISLMRASCPAHLICPGFIALYRSQTLKQMAASISRV